MQKILLVAEGTAGVRSAVSLLRSMNTAPGSTVMVRVDLAGGASGKETPVRGSAGTMDRCRRAAGAPGGMVRTLGRGDDPSREILKIAREEGVDLIIIGRGRSIGFRRFFSRDVTKEVELHATVPVLVGRTGDGKKSILNGWRGKNAA